MPTLHPPSTRVFFHIWYDRLGLVLWALNSSNVAQVIPPSNVLMGEIKLGFFPANEDAGTMPSPTSTKQNKQLVWWTETSDSNRTSEQ